MHRTNRIDNYFDRFAAHVDGFNRKPLRLCDLYAYCERQNIEVVEMQMRQLHGGAHEYEGFQFIYINSLITYSEQIIAGFHELFHTLNHVGNGELCFSYGRVNNLSKQEFQAQAVGVVALMPLTEVYEMTVDRMMYEYTVSRQIAELRFNIFQQYQR
jgi:Zn-dependent peptidase ImmA (M78 family)